MGDALKLSASHLLSATNFNFEFFPLSPNQIMTDPNPTPNSSSLTPTQPSVMRCISGSLISSAIATAGYFLTSSIAQSFANKPIHSDNVAVVNISSAVRTLVVGLSTMATGIFALVSLGLMALGLKILIQQLGKQSAPPSDAQS